MYGYFLKITFILELLLCKVQQGVSLCNNKLYFTF